MVGLCSGLIASEVNYTYKVPGDCASTDDSLPMSLCNGTAGATGLNGAGKLMSPKITAGSELSISGESKTGDIAKTSHAD